MFYDRTPCYDGVIIEKTVGKVKPKKENVTLLSLSLHLSALRGQILSPLLAAPPQTPSCVPSRLVSLVGNGLAHSVSPVSL